MHLKLLVLLTGSLLNITGLLAGDYSIVEENKRKGLIDRKGNILIPVEYEDLGWSQGYSEVSEEVIGYKTGDLWGLISTKNVKITNAEYLTLIPFNKNSIIASKYDSYKLTPEYGLISYNGKVLLDFKYSSLEGAENVIIASRKNGSGISFGIIDQKENQVVPFNYYQISNLSKTLFLLTKQNGKKDIFSLYGDMMVENIDEIRVLPNHYLEYQVDGQLGIMNSEGEIITNPIYQKIRVSEDGSINALETTRWSFLNFQNEEISSFSYDDIFPIDTGIYKTNNSIYNYIVDSRNNRLFSIKDSDISILNDSLALVKSGKKYGVINYRGEIIIKPLFEQIKISQNRLFLLSSIQHIRGWKIADLYGIILCESDFDAIERINETYLSVYKNGFWGITNNDGKEVIYPKYDSIYMAINNRFLVNLLGETGVLNMDGEWEILPQKGNLSVFPNKQYLISSYAGSVYYDEFGEMMFETQNYIHLENFGFIEEEFTGKLGLLNKQLEQVLPVGYDFIAPLIKDSIFIFLNEKGWGLVENQSILFENEHTIQKVLGYNENLILVIIDDHYGFIDLNGKLRIANRYDEATLFHEGIANIKLLGKWGAINKNEQIVIQPNYEYLENFQSGLAIAVKDSKFGIINNSGSTIINFEYDSIYRINNGGFICMLGNNSGLINKKGELSFYPKFDLIMDLGNGFVIVSRKGNFGVFTNEGISAIPIIYDHIKYDPFNNLIIASKKENWKNIMNNSTTNQ